MFYRRETFRVHPEKLKLLNEYFHEFVLPNQVKNGARLIGRWVTEGNNEVTVMWEYPSFEEYFKIEERVLKDEMYRLAEEKLRNIGPLYEDFSQDFLKSTGIYNLPKQSVTVSGYITNEKNEVLLIQTYWRYAGGELRVSNETKDVRFVKINKTNIHHYIRRRKLIPRVLDAMTGNCIPYEAFKVRPYELIKRLDENR